MSATQSALSVKATESQPTPSAVYSCCSTLNINSQNCWCNFSLVKLMHSCSNELCSKTSKPKMSRTPMKSSADLALTSAASTPPDVDDAWFSRFTIQSNSRWYTCLASASRKSTTSSAVFDTEYVELRPPPEILRVVKIISRICGCASPSIFDTSTMRSLFAGVMRFIVSSNTNSMLPMCRTAATVRKTDFTSSSVKSYSLNEFMTSLNSLRSSNPGTSTAVDWFR
mmetsp:Transcript_10672/g.33825  ORF Transcript_10672/g.33825 Transcript_10672/m.33825 type:complete len:226 (+) Transcript_10672:1651-2328(+)